MTYEYDVTAGNAPLGTILTTLGDAELREGSGFRVTAGGAQGRQDLSLIHI